MLDLKTSLSSGATAVFTSYADSCTDWLSDSHISIYTYVWKNGTHYTVGKLKLCAVSSTSIKCGRTANVFKFDVVSVYTLLSGKWKPSINIWKFIYASTQSSVVTCHCSGVVYTFHECLYIQNCWNSTASLWTRQTSCSTTLQLTGCQIASFLYIHV